jgi:hypothetical protein
MSLKDQMGWALRSPWALLAGPLHLDVPHGPLGDGERDLAAEYGRALRYVLRAGVGLGPLVAAAWRRRPPEREQLGYALLHAERLAAILAAARAAEALVATAAGNAERVKVAERYIRRALPQAHMLAEVVCSGDRSTLEALS